MKHKIDKNSADRSELESIIRRQSSELTRTQNLLSQTDFDLKEARFEMNRIHEREAKLKDEKQLIETKSKEIIGELKQQLQQKNIVAGERTQIAVFECDKLIKTLASLYKSVFDGRGSNALAPKTTKQLLDKASRDAENLKEFLQSKTPATSSEGQVSILQARLSAENVRQFTTQFEYTTDIFSFVLTAGREWLWQCPIGHVSKSGGREQVFDRDSGDDESAAGRI